MSTEPTDHPGIVALRALARDLNDTAAVHERRAAEQVTIAQTYREAAGAAESAAYRLERNTPRPADNEPPF